MENVMTSIPVSTGLRQATAAAVGYLAATCAAVRLPLRVLRSAAGHYIGTADDEGPVSRESVEYFPSRAAAEAALASGQWTQLAAP
jgi:hypothetical protein